MYRSHFVHSICNSTNVIRGTKISYVYRLALLCIMVNFLKPNSTLLSIYLAGHNLCPAVLCYDSKLKIILFTDYSSLFDKPATLYSLSILSAYPPNSLNFFRVSSLECRLDQTLDLTKFFS